MEKLSVIVPCYNEEEALPLFYAEICRVAETEQSVEWEFDFVDDGSKDGTLPLLRALAAKDGRVRFTSFSRNFGKESAMYAGFQMAQGDYCAVMDADLQDPPALLPQMLRAIREEGYDSVATRRVTREGEPKLRSFFARKFYRIMNGISDADIVDGARDFRLMRRAMADAVLSMGEYSRFSKGIFGWVGFKTKWLPYKNVERAAGTTKWSFRKLFKYAVEGIVSYSSAPLLIAYGLGALFCAAAFLLFLVLVIVSLASGRAIPAAGGIIALILFVGGAQLGCLGILGEYVSRTYLETKKRPVYIVRETEKGLK